MPSNIPDPFLGNGGLRSWGKQGGSGGSNSTHTKSDYCTKVLIVYHFLGPWSRTQTKTAILLASIMVSLLLLSKEAALVMGIALMLTLL